VSELPAGWAEATLAEIGEEARGSLLPTFGTIYEMYSVPTFPTRRPEILDGSEIGSTKRVVEPGDVLICKINPRINRVWIVSEPLSPDREQIASTEYLVLRTSNSDLSRYIMWYLQSPAFREWIKLSVEGATGSHTRAKSGPILRQRIPVPPLNEQRRIVAAIEEQFSRLDAADESLLTSQRKLERLRALTIQMAISGSWPSAPLAEVAHVVSGQTPRGLTSVATGQIPYYKVGDMNFASGNVMSSAREYLDDDTVSAFKLKVRPAGTVIFPKRGGAIATNKKRILKTPAVIDLNTMGVIPGERLTSAFVYLWFSALDLSSLADGSNVPQINHTDVEPLQIPVPPVEEQVRVVAEVEQHLSVIDAMARAIETAKRRSATLRRSILERAFRGELVPQDSSDEPASALLERIRVERAATATTPNRRRVSA
jgi:type I restriction enzyme S subunit